MTRKDYVLIAKAVRYAFDGMDTPKNAAYWDGVAQVAQCLSDSLKQDNKRFEADRFLKACGVTQ